MEAAICGDIPLLDKLMYNWTQDWREANDALSQQLAALAVSRPIDAALESGGASRTLSDQLARRLLHEIRSLNWPVGKRLGDEPDMLARYGVSRATFRQAVRMLEQYFAVQTRRGPGGGLFVTSPDPGRVNDLTIAALMSAGVTTRHIEEVRGQIVSLAFDQALAQGDEGRARIAAMFETAAAIAASDPQDAVRSLHRDVGRVGNTRSAEFTLDLLLLLGDRLGVADPAGEAPGRIGYLIDQAVQSFRAGDVGRSKRALLDVIRKLDPAPAD
jgi:DNA-binding transcriptional regulator YhcF (GntR family)